MSGASPQFDPRLLELLAARALDGLADPQEAAELQQLLAKHGFDEAPDELELVAASLHLAMFQPGDLEACPAHVRERLLASIPAKTTDGVAGRISPSSQRTSPMRIGPRLAWIAAAAGIILAILAWLPRLSSPAAPPSQADIQAFVNAHADAVRLAWGDWDTPEVAGVKGEVIWSDSAQAGYLRFVDLPRRPSDEVYQLWIIDATRGMEQRISGGIFNGATGELIIPITAGLHVNQAAAFAVTIEGRGGTWVSDMSRRVVIAARG